MEAVQALKDKLEWLDKQTLSASLSGQLLQEWER